MSQRLWRPLPGHLSRSNGITAAKALVLTAELREQPLRPQLRVALQHLPVLVAGDERDLLDGKARFEQAAGGFVAEVMEVQVFDAECLACSLKRRSRRLGIVRKAAWTIEAQGALVLQQLPGVETGGGEQGNALVVAVFLAGILAIRDEDRARALIQGVPLDAEDLINAHGGRDRELDHPRHRHRVAVIGVEVRVQLGELLLGRPALAFRRAGDEPQPPQGNARQVYGFGVDRDAVHGRGMRQDRADEGNIDREGGGAGASLCPLPPVHDEALAGHVGESGVAKFGAKPLQYSILRPAKRLADRGHVFDMQINQAGEAVAAADLVGGRVDLLVDRVLRLTRPFFGSRLEMEGFGEAMTVAPDLHPPLAFALHNRGHGPSLRLVFDLALAPWCKSGAPQSETPGNWRNVRRTNGCKQLHPTD